MKSPTVAKSENISYVKSFGGRSRLHAAGLIGGARRKNAAAALCRATTARRRSARSPISICLIALAAALTLAQVVSVAKAQSSSSSMSFFGEADFKPALSRSNLDVFVRVLRLSESEVQAMNDLYDGYAETVTREAASVRETMYEAMEESEAYVDPARLTELGAYKRMDEWRARVEELKLAFVDDLKTLLTKEQEQRWPIVERELRRMKLVGGRLSGEGIDLIEMLSDLKIAPMPPEAESLVESYSQELDRLLVQRKAFIDDNGEKYAKLVASDAPAAEALFRDALRVRVAIRDLNLRTAERLREILPADAADRLREAVMKVLTERFSYHKSRAEALIAAALEFDSLTPEQRLQIEDLSASLTARVADWRDRMIRVVRTHEEEELPRDLALALGREKKAASSDYEWALPPDHPLVKMRQERFEFEREARRKLKSILTAEQVETLPAGREMYTLFVSNRAWGL